MIYLAPDLDLQGNDLGYVTGDQNVFRLELAMKIFVMSLIKPQMCVSMIWIFDI